MNENFKFQMKDKDNNIVQLEEKWMRTCQECLNKQEDNQPAPESELTRAYEMRKCKKCKSEALDYGSIFLYDNKGNEWEIVDSDDILIDSFVEPRK